MNATPSITIEPENTQTGQKPPLPIIAPCIGELTSQKNDIEKNSIPSRKLPRVIDQKKEHKKIFTDPISLGFLVRLATAAGRHETYAPTRVNGAKIH